MNRAVRYHERMSFLHRRRCAWVSDDPLYRAYHDTQWGVPPRGDRALFELLTLEGVQAGLSWLTVLKKRDAYREAFDGFNPGKVAQYGERKISALVTDTRIIRNRAKIRSAISNARAFLSIQKEFGSFSAFLEPYRETIREKKERIVSASPICETGTSRALSAELIRRGFRFVGPVICYAFMQAVGLAGGHEKWCWKYADKKIKRRGVSRRKKY